MSEVDVPRSPEHGGRLSDRDKALLTRLLSDPTAYPQPLKAWIVSYLEGSDLDLPAQNVHGLEERLKSIERRLTSLETP